MMAESRTQVVEYLSSKLKAPSKPPSLPKKEQKGKKKLNDVIFCSLKQLDRVLAMKLWNSVDIKQ
jgi:hypothetical protein